MDTADENYVAGAPQALRVEQCQCPPSYRGHSCEVSLRFFFNMYERIWKRGIL